jgi:hypothetical protein
MTTVRDIRRNIANGAFRILSNWLLSSVRSPPQRGDMPIHQIVGDHHPLRRNLPKLRGNAVGVIPQSKFPPENCNFSFGRSGVEAQFA